MQISRAVMRYALFIAVGIRCAVLSIPCAVLSIPCAVRAALAQGAPQETSQPPMSLLQDVNGDGVVDVLAFGDSLTRGVGDGAPVSDDMLPIPAGEAGYPLRTERYLHISVANFGVPGEQLVQTGLQRFVSSVLRERPDIVVFSEGANDSRSSVSRGEYFHLVQTAINVARASGSHPVLATIVPPCCNHIPFRGLIESYNADLNLLAALNGVPLADVDHAFRNTCNVDRCSLLNIPEGLHPNAAGYDVFGEVVTATLLQINIFTAEGQMMLQQALQLTPGTIKTVPDMPAPAPVATPGPVSGA